MNKQIQDVWVITDTTEPNDPVQGVYSSPDVALDEMRARDTSDAEWVMEADRGDDWAKFTCIYEADLRVTYHAQRFPVIEGRSRP